MLIIFVGLNGHMRYSTKSVPCGRNAYDTFTKKCFRWVIISLYYSFVYCCGTMSKIFTIIGTLLLLHAAYSFRHCEAASCCLFASSFALTLNFSVCFSQTGACDTKYSHSNFDSSWCKLNDILLHQRFYLCFYFTSFRISRLSLNSACHFCWFYWDNYCRSKWNQ